VCERNVAFTNFIRTSVLSYYLPILHIKKINICNYAYSPKEKYKYHDKYGHTITPVLSTPRWHLENQPDKYWTFKRNITTVSPGIVT